MEMKHSCFSERQQLHPLHVSTDLTPWEALDAKPRRSSTKAGITESRNGWGWKGPLRII